MFYLWHIASSVIIISFLFILLMTQYYWHSNAAIPVSKSTVLEWGNAQIPVIQWTKSEGQNEQKRTRGVIPGSSWCTCRLTCLDLAWIFPVHMYQKHKKTSKTHTKWKPSIYLCTDRNRNSSRWFHFSCTSVGHSPCSGQGLYRSSYLTEVQPPADLWFVVDCKLWRFCHAVYKDCLCVAFPLILLEFTLQPFLRFRQSWAFVSSSLDTHTPEIDT